MQLCSRCNAAVDHGRSHCPICDQPTALIVDATVVDDTVVGPATTPSSGLAVPPGHVPPPGYGPAPYAHVPPPPGPQGYGPMGYGPPPVGYGVPMYAPVGPVLLPPKSKATAALLCFFLGMLGVHRFYTGQTGLGLGILLSNLILGTLTCGLWFVVTSVWVTVDFIVILCGGVRDQWGRPLV